jgi:ribosomal protein S18 acetylase RimI-like enzyme
MNSCDVHTIREMTPADLPEILTIQNSCFKPQFLETISIFAEKLSLFPSGCFVANNGSKCTGYLFSHPWPAGQSAPLNKSLYPLPTGCDSLYLHDCAVHPDAQGCGLAKKLINKVIETAVAIGANSIQLVSVQHSEVFWKHFGFDIVNKESPQKTRNLTTYGSDAVLMSLKLAL